MKTVPAKIEFLEKYPKSVHRAWQRFSKELLDAHGGLDPDPNVSTNCPRHLYWHLKAIDAFIDPPADDDYEVVNTENGVVPGMWLPQKRESAA